VGGWTSNFVVDGRRRDSARL